MDGTPQRGASLCTPSRRSRSSQPSTSKSTFNDESTLETAEDVEITTICIIGDRLRQDEAVMAAIKSFKLKIIYSSENLENVDQCPLPTTAFIMEDFEGPNAPSAYEALYKNKACIIGPTAIKELAARCKRPVFCDRPLFSHAMEGLGICFNRYKNKEYIRRNFSLIQNMGGSVLKEISTARVTHLVADSCRGERYRYASTFGIPILSGDWIGAAWNRRHEIGFRADSRDFILTHKVKPFHGARILFYGFTDEERTHMVSELVRNGGAECQKMGDPSITHVVVDDANVTSLPTGLLAANSDAPLVKSEWFWASIQMDACAEEKLHEFNDQPDSHLFLSPQANNGHFSPGTPGRSQSGRKRKRRKEMMSQLANLDPVTLQHSLNKRRSSVSELTMLSMSGSFLDTPSPAAGSAVMLPANMLTPVNLLTPDTNHLRVPTSPEVVAAMTPTKTPLSVADTNQQSPGVHKALAKMDLRSMTPRQQVFHELVQTEANYIAILKTILDVFKRNLEDPNLIGGPLLNQTQIKIIFGNLPPIYEVHSRMMTEFYQALQNWQDTFSIGSVYLKYAEELLKAYPPYINFFEASKEMLFECDKNNPRFHAFLKVCQSKQECGRQSLDELMMRPIQRLPSVTLLLNDLLKHTKREKDHPDILNLDSALTKIKEVLTHINKDKQKTEGQVQIFKIFSDIENCPPHLVSSHRSFISKVDVIEVGGHDELCGKGYELSLFLFSDVLEVCKKRGAAKGLGLRSPSTMSLRTAGMGQTGTLSGQGQGLPGSHHSGHRSTMKHVHLFNLTAVKRVIDVIVSDSESGGNGNNIFALICRNNQELKERMFTFQMVSAEDHSDKMSFMRTLCRHIANTNFRPDTETFLRPVAAEELGFDINDIHVSNFGTRAVRSLHRKVNRAFSFDRTPTSMRLKRAVSSMISPLSSSNSSSGHHAHNASSTPVSDRLRHTPSGVMQNLRLASCTNLMNSALAGESPRSSRSSRKSSSSSIGASSQSSLSPQGMMPPPPMPPLHLSATPKKAMTLMAAASPASMNGGDVETENRGFRTPNQCVRRPSLKMKAASFLGVGGSRK